MSDGLGQFDEMLNHQIDLQQYGNGVARRLAAILHRVEDDILAQIALAEAAPSRMAQLELLLAQIRQMLAAAYESAHSTLQRDLRAFTDVELQAQAQILAASEVAAGFSQLSPDLIYTAAMAQPFQGRFLREWFASLAQADQQRYSDQLRIGYVEGESLRSIMNRVRGLSSIRESQLESVVRTALSHFQNFAQHRLYEQAGVKYQQLIAVLDGVTSAICRGRSNKVYALESAPRLPFHPRCRSSYLPLSSREALVVPSYSDWLKGQPRSRQDDILGPTRARLWREGKLTLDKFVNRRGRELILDELRARYPGYWRRAGLADAA